MISLISVGSTSVATVQQLLEYSVVLIHGDLFYGVVKLLGSVFALLPKGKGPNRNHRHEGTDLFS